jgi:pimeloyl-ACP methyl ester carboxylesterase
MTRKGLAGWISVVVVLGLVVLGAIEVRRHRWQLRVLQSRLEDTSLTDLRLGVFAPGRRVEVLRGDQLRLVASEYDPADEPRAVILLLHGNTPLGRKLALYRVLAHRLAELGYFVLAPDFAGFGESGDPFSIPYEGGFSADLDVQAWLDYLASDPRSHRKSLFVIAHSAGASSGLPIGLGDPRVAGIIAIGPSRNVIEHFEDPKQVDYWWRRTRSTYRQVYGRELPDWYTRERWLSEAVGEGSGAGMKRPMEQYLPMLQEEGHHPVLLVDGERELEEDKTYLEAYYEAMAEPKDYQTLARSDHYSNIGELGPLVVYDRQVVDATVSLLDRWITDILDATPPGL